MKVKIERSQQESLLGDSINRKYMFTFSSDETRAQKKLERRFQFPKAPKKFLFLYCGWSLWSSSFPVSEKCSLFSTVCYEYTLAFGRPEAVFSLHPAILLSGHSLSTHSTRLSLHSFHARSPLIRDALSPLIRRRARSTPHGSRSSLISLLTHPSHRLLSPPPSESRFQCPQHLGVMGRSKGRCQARA